MVAFANARVLLCMWNFDDCCNTAWNNGPVTNLESLLDFFVFIKTATFVAFADDIFMNLMFHLII